MTQYDERHGGPYDRGSADSYYGRPGKPHYFVSGTGMGERVEVDQMTQEEIAAYWAGFDDNEKAGFHKEW